MEHHSKPVKQVTKANAQYVAGPLEMVMKQKRGGSHEEHTRDRMKQLLEVDNNIPATSNYTSRVATAAANQKAFGLKSQHALSYGQKRVNSATTRRSIHMKQEHLKDG